MKTLIIAWSLAATTTIAWAINSPTIKEWATTLKTKVNEQPVKYAGHTMKVNNGSMVYDCRLVLPTKSLRIVRK